MERLSKIYPSGAWGITGEVDDAILRLAAYEDTGLEPEEARSQKELFDYLVFDSTPSEDIERFKRLRELAEADREGRCVVSPVSIGDTVYHITACKNFSQVLDGTLYGPNGELGTATGLYCPCELAEICPFLCDSDGGFDCDEHKNTIAIFEDIITGIFIDDMQDILNLEYSGSADFDAFGKTVFLTREEAEAALAKSQLDS